MKKIIFILTVISFIALTAIIYLNESPEQRSLTEPPQGGDFVLNTQEGKFSLEKQRGKVVLIYFGYTFCPDICPTNLSLMAQALNELTESELNEVVPVFISVDPERDTVDQLHNYTNYFHSRILGMTGSEASIAKISQKYGAAYQKVTGESDGGYLIDHSSFTYLVDKHGNLAEIFPHATDPMVMIESIRKLLQY